ncbi:PIN domain-containing protein [Mesorhizobium sp. BAC0120]|uniref:PIN domain-containing protein n=1 Tax=Mesorhizobium sp. BAC0120 TaxID=3090670 RepID=UPI00298C5EB9|nr:PIN domain-containing protein [Mesorhizobium sp. BAC0120]MDW6025564.1 PIN domain-containing protein [Mesorhizobium sp. BAC0120]
MSSPDTVHLPRAPSSIVIVDANVILSVVLGRRSRTVFATVDASRLLATSSRAAEEIRGVLKNIPNLQPHVMEAADVLLDGIQIIDKDVYSPLMDGAAWALRHAVPSKNGSERDAHLLACAWAFDADIWSHDRDLAGSGWASWSTANLRNALEAEGAIEVPQG